MLEDGSFSMKHIHVPVLCLCSQEAATATDYDVLHAPSDSSGVRVEKPCHQVLHVDDHIPEPKCKTVCMYWYLVVIFWPM